MLSDPDLATFKDIERYRVGKDAIIACGWVNSKNGLGGYSCFTRFVSNGHLIPRLKAIFKGKDLPSTAQATSRMLAILHSCLQQNPPPENAT